MDQVDLVESLKLEPLVNEQKCLTLLEECSAAEYTGRNKIDSRILHGYRWLLNQIIHDYDALNIRVECDKKKEAEKFEARRNELRQRLAGNMENGYSTSNGQGDKLPYGDKIIHVSPPSASIVPQEYLNGTIPDDCAHDGRPKINDITRHVRDQLERQSFKEIRKGSGVKKNKITPLNVNDERRNFTHEIASSSNHVPFNDFENDNSLMLQALTSPYMKKKNFKQKLPPLKIPSALRPLTSKSLGYEGTAWDLDKELEVVDPHHIGRSSELAKVRNFNELELS